MNKRVDKYFYETFLIALILVLLPSRSLGYIVPFVCLAWYMVRAQSGMVLKRTVVAFVAYLFIIALYLILYEIEDLEFLPRNTVVSLITYGSFIFILLVDGKFVTPEYSYEKYARVLSYTVAIQGLVGIFQFCAVTFTGRFNILPGDAVQGTVGLFAFVNEVAGFGNQMFAINMVFFLVFLIPNILVHRRGFVSVGLGLFSLMLAGVLHVFIGLILSMLLTLFFFRKNLLFSNLGKLISAVVLAALLILPLGLIFPGVFRTANVFVKIYQNRDSPKFEIVDRTVGDLPDKHPFVYLVGLGPGQYLSRAGLMSSGQYLDREVPFFSNTMAAPFREFGLSIWNSYEGNTNKFGSSTMHRPYFSLLSVFAEFGLICLIILFIYLATLMAKMRRAYLIYLRDGQSQNAYLTFSLGLLLIFIPSIAFFDNYLETTQAIFPGLLLMKAFYQALITTSLTDTPQYKAGRMPQQLSRA